jgi:hypothetical protein
MTDDHLAELWQSVATLTETELRQRRSGGTSASS